MTPEHPPLLPILGWREWLALPALGVEAIKAKVDTGACTSALHACGIRVVRRGDRQWVRFQVNPIQRDTTVAVVAEAELLEYRRVRTSSGQQSLRPVIRTTVSLGERVWPIELTLVDRDAMGFRMLLGREALGGRFVVDPGRSFVGGEPRLE